MLFLPKDRILKFSVINFFKNHVNKQGFFKIRRCCKSGRIPYSVYKLHSEQSALRKNNLTETKPPDLNRSAGIDAEESSEILS